MRKVLIGTPSYDGKLDVWYVDSLMNTQKLCIESGQVDLKAVYVSYDALVQRARNTLFKIAMDGGYDDLFFIDFDVEWQPEWILKLLACPEPVVGAALVKKSERESYTIKLVEKDLKWNERRDLIEVEGVGTGFLKISRFAMEKLWEASEPYMDLDKGPSRMVFDIKIENGDLVSEDYVACNKWRALGYKTWIDPTITINHIGNKKYVGDFNKFITEHGYK